MDLQIMGQNARQAALKMMMTTTQQRRTALFAMADALQSRMEEILISNAAEIEKARQGSFAEGFIDRLLLNPERIEAMAHGLRVTAELPDPLAIEEASWTRPNGLVLQKVHVPLGVVGIIFESRPNVTADAAGLCIMSGNVCILRGGSEAIRTNGVIVDILQDALLACGMPEHCVQLLKDPSREKANEMMRLHGLIDVLIPRGGAGLIATVVQNATIPVIETGAGICHTYIDAGCSDFAMARNIAINAKCSRPSVCNAMECMLVHQEVADAFLPQCLQELVAHGVEIRGCQKTLALFPSATLANEQDYATEYNDLILSVLVVKDIHEAMSHIQRYGTGHSECIVTQDPMSAQLFTKQVDAANVYVNASTRFTDGFAYGFGAEIGISTQKLHARGPMGLEQLTTYKYIVHGNGQIR